MRVASIKREFVIAVVSLVAVGISLVWGVEHASLKTESQGQSRNIHNSTKAPIAFTASRRAEDVALDVVDGIRGERRHGRSITGKLEPAPFAPAAAINYVPNTFTDPSVSPPFSVRTSDGHIMNGAVDTGVVSLRSAVIAANANVNINPEFDTITLGTGTYSLTIPGTGEIAQPGDPLIGDVDVKTTGLKIQGNGAALTTIQQTSGIDRPIDVNPPFAIGNFFFTIDGVTITGGRSQSGDAGGLYSGSNDTGLMTKGKITVSNCVFKNNTVINPGFGGGGMQNFGGDLQITNTTFGGAGATDLNTAQTSGGGLAVVGATNAHTVTITNVTFTNNTASSLSSGGGGLDIAANGAPSVGTTVLVSGSTFTGNKALGTASGGAIMNESNITTIVNTQFNNNTAGNRAGGVYVGGGSLHLDGTSPSITFTGNTAGIAAATSMSASAPVTVSGTNVSIGGSIEVTTNGSWTNNAGTTLSPTDVLIVGGTLTMNNSTMNVAGNLTFQANGVAGFTFNGNSGTVNLGGSLSTTGGGSSPASSFSGGTGTFNFNGSGAQVISGSLSPTFFNLTDSNTTQALAINNSPVVNGTFNVLGAGATINPAAASIISGTGTLTGTGTVRVTRTAATAGFGNQYTITNKTLTNLTVDYVGGAAQVLTALTYGGLRINNASGVNMSGNSTVNGQLTLTNGALGVGTNTLTINNGVSLVMGTITSAATGTVQYNQASGGQNVAVGSYGNLTFSNQTKVLPAGTVGIAGTFTPGSAIGHTITGSTIDFNGTGAQTVPAFNYNNLTLSGARGPSNVTLINAGTIGIAGTFSPTATFTSGAYVVTGNTVNYNGAGPQTITAFAYNNLTSSNTGTRTLANAGTIFVAGALTPGTNTYTITGSTINFNGTGAQTIPAFNYNNLTSSSSGTRTLAGAGIIGIAGAFTPGANVYTIAGSTVDFNGSGAQTIPAFNYNHLTSSNSGARTLANAGTIGVFGNFTSGTNVYTITGSTINFNGTGSQNIPAFNYNNLTSSSTGARVLANGGTIGVAAAFTPGGNTYTTTGSTISYNGAAAQNITVFPYNNLSTAGSGIKSLTGATTVGGALTIGAATTLDVTATNFALNVAGNWTNNGTFTQRNGTVTLNGSSQQTIGGTSLTSFFNLILNNANGALLAQNAAVDGLLTLTSGTFNTGTNILTLNNGTSVGGGSLNGSLGTVNYNQGTNGQVVLAGQYNNLIFSNSNKVLPNGGTIGISGTFTPGGGVHTITGSTIDFNGTGAQTIPAFNYFNLTSSSTGARTLAAAGTIGIFNAFTPGTNAYTITGSTINFNGNGAQTIPAFNYNNLTSSSTGARTLASSGIVGVAGAFTPGTNVYTIAGSTINFNGAGAQTIPAFNYNNLTSSNTGARTLANTGIIRVASVFTPGTNVFTVTGSTVEYNGSAPQTQPATAFTYHNLTINNATGVTLSANATVNQDLTLNNGNITTGTPNTVFVGAAGNVVRTAGHVVGNLEKAFSGPTTFTYQVGTTAYTPVIAQVTAGSGQLRVRANNGVPVVTPVPIDPAKTLQRFFTLSGSGITSNITFTYVDADVPATTSESVWNVIRVTGNTVIRYPPGPNIIFNTGANIFTVNGLTTYSDWTAGEPLAPTAANASVTGRVLDRDGRGVAGALVSMQGQQGNAIWAVTNPFGYYRFVGVQTGQTYIVAVQNKRFVFEPRTVNVNDDIVGLDFSPSP